MLINSSQSVLDEEENDVSPRDPSVSFQIFYYESANHVSYQEKFFCRNNNLAPKHC